MDRKSPNTVRILLQNPDGLAATNQFRKFELLCQNAISHSVDLICLPETCIDWKQPQAIQTCRTILRKYCPVSRMYTSCSSVPAPRSYLPGGTAAIAFNNITGRIIASGADNSLGRWNYIRLRAAHNSHLLIVTAYCVCSSSINTTGPTTAFRQQYTILRSQGHHAPNPRTQFISDLRSFLIPYHEMGDHILLLGDFNTDIQQSRQS